MKTYTKEQLNEIIENHQKWLKGDGGNHADLSGASLRDVDLIHADLRHVNLSEANLSYADLSEANLSYADLSGSNLIGAKLSGSNLIGANLSDVNLSYVDLGGANLCGVNLCHANLKYANLRRVDLRYFGSMRDTTGNGAEIKTIQTDRWVVTYTSTHMQIGCQLHKIADWWVFTDDHIAAMEGHALEWWKKWKPILKQIIEMSPAIGV